MSVVILEDSIKSKASIILNFLASYNKVTGESGEPVDCTLDELEERVKDRSDPETLKSFYEYMCKKHPDLAIDLGPYEPQRLYRVKPGTNYRMTVPGTIVSVSGIGLCDCGNCKRGERVEIKFDILRSPTYWVGMEVVIDMKDLEEVTVDQLRREEKV